MNYVLLALVAAVLTLGGIASCEHKEKVAIQATFDAFKIQVETVGKDAAKAAKAQELVDNAKKAKADDDRKKLLADNATLVKRLSSYNSNRSTVSAPTPSPGSADRICFDPTLFTGALRGFDEGLQRYESGVFGIAKEGSKAIINLDSAKKWAVNEKITSHP